MVVTMITTKTDEYLQHQAVEQAKYCSIFSNSRRVQILWTLIEREMSVGEIADAVGTSLQNVSQHLSKMKEYDIVSSRRDGQTIYYRIKEGALILQCSTLLREINPELAISNQTNK